VSKENVQTEVVEYQRIDKVSDVLKVDIDQSKLTIKETIITRRYDKDTGNLTEETTTEREIAQDSDKMVTEEANENVTDSHGLEAKQLRESTQKMDADIKEESIGWQESFGKYFGISLGVGIGILLLYLLRKILS
jgi:tetrahydromethanopterin S-methyltransferase subunit A